MDTDAILGDRRPAGVPILLRAAGWTIRFCAIVVAVELLARLVMWWMQISPPAMADAVRGWRMAPHSVMQMPSSDGPYLMTINSRGFRDKEYNYEKAAGRARIIVVGGSNAIGIGVPIEDCCTEVLERMLVDTDVINMACVVYELDQQYLLLREEGLKYKPDVVLQFVNDAGPAWLFLGDGRIGMPKCRTQPIGDDGSFEILPPYFPWWRQLTRYSAVLRVVDMLTAVVGRKEPKPVVDKQNAEVHGRVIRKLLETTRDLVTAGGARHVVVFLPVDRTEGSKTHELLLDMSRMGQITLLDLSDLFQPAQKEDEPVLISADDKHLTEFAHYRIAESVRDFLRDRGIMPKSRIVAPTP